MRWAPIVVAGAALVFTVGTFWWMNWRRGRLHVFVPGSYAATTQRNRLILLLPLVFYNDGPVPYIVRDLRLRFADDMDGIPLQFQRTRGGVSPKHHPDLLDLGAAFPVPGNRTVRLFCEFERRPANRQLNAGQHPVLLEALTNHDASWKLLLQFDFNVNEEAAAAIPGDFVAFRNSMD